MQTDAAHSSSLYDLWAWFEKNKKPVIIGTASAAAIALVVCFVVLQREEKAKAVGQEFSNVWLQQHATGGPHPGAATAFLKFAAEHSGSAPGAQAVLLAAAAYFDEGKYEEAKAQFQRFIREYSDSPFASEAYLGLASCLDAAGKSDDAMTAYSDLIDHHPSQAILPQAKFALARLYQAQGKPDRARTLYQDVEQSSPPYSILGQEAALRIADLEAAYPALAPKATLSAPALSMPNK